ncbi:MAG TPA: N-acetylglucosamine-6-phosphate deacetylase [Cyanobacteria bacterium UBA11149]|nr:N-acetylglucosamine-6-phosphate deacetylase [Cyanobacteria bacterium UBA11367]HBE60861.1 N-acetylglucosamine-6-phosphate deacetylase [Cyanobacteria bacterium UBA11366]HBR72196.1 N-acetylglucosamine-6-phosphate deacetylase [Cyanobacteria bacterium UBA11159]HBS72086.1 N-acetylglucosamine-6-phosphate deacetylase [Cyanobacteria bacterium UBA11153]HBW90033.1 N-acetylglucosamine-6-phosphate deacetylase [Cyanobacteria bacterium UBA11149]HCA93116.1 N-acetylglucosamine-6-phosphate deacetylase [Cyano
MAGDNNQKEKSPHPPISPLRVKHLDSQILVKQQNLSPKCFTPTSNFSLSPLPILDVAGDWISLGGVDLQINGALGLAFPDLSVGDGAKLREICRFLWQEGVDGFLPTIVTTSVDKIQQSLSVIADFLASGLGDGDCAEILGVHVEGPFLNYAKRGAHPAEYLLPLTMENVKRVLGDYADLVKVMTVAPELDETGNAIAYLKSLGITISLGHSLATAAEAQKAFLLGASMVTHAFNAMPLLHHREPGLLGAAIVHPHVYCGIIADGQHVCPTMLAILLKASNYEDGLFLVSDALSPLGLPDGIYPWDSREIEVKQGTARLADGTLSGTTLPLLAGVQNLVEWKVCDVETAIALATTSPRIAIGLSGFSVGNQANLLRWHWDEAICQLTWERFSTSR